MEFRCMDHIRMAELEHFKLLKLIARTNCWIISRFTSNLWQPLHERLIEYLRLDLVVAHLVRPINESNFRPNQTIFPSAIWLLNSINSEEIHNSVLKSFDSTSVVGEYTHTTHWFVICFSIYGDAFDGSSSKLYRLYKHVAVYVNKAIVQIR